MHPVDEGQVTADESETNDDLHIGAGKFRDPCLRMIAVTRGVIIQRLTGACLIVRHRTMYGSTAEGSSFLQFPRLSPAD